MLGNVRALFSSFFRRMLLARESSSHSSLNRRNYRDGRPGDPAKTIGSGLAGAGLQAHKEKVSDLSAYLFVQSRRESKAFPALFIYTQHIYLNILSYFLFLAGNASTAR